MKQAVILMSIVLLFSCGKRPDGSSAPPDKTTQLIGAWKVTSFTYTSNNITTTGIWNPQCNSDDIITNDIGGVGTYKSTCNGGYSMTTNWYVPNDTTYVYQPNGGSWQYWGIVLVNSSTWIRKATMNTSSGQIITMTQTLTRQ